VHFTVFHTFQRKASKNDSNERGGEQVEVSFPSSEISQWYKGVDLSEAVEMRI